MRWPYAVGGQGELGRERRVAGAELEGFGDQLVVDGLITLPDRGPALRESQTRCRHRQHREQGQDGKGTPPQAAAADGGPLAGLQEVTLGAAQDRRAGRVR